MRAGCGAATGGAAATTPVTAPSTVPREACRSQSRFLFESGAFCSDWACELVAACQISCVIAPCCAHNSSSAKTTCTTALRRLMARLFCQTLLEAGYEQVFGQLLADEDQDRLLLVRLGPGLAEVAAHHHVHALEHHPPSVALHPQDALVAQQVRPVDLDHARQELLELLAVERLFRAEHERLDRVVVLVVELGEEFRVELQDGVQVEAADVEHVRERRVAEVHLLDRRARVHPPQPVDQFFSVFLVGQVCFGEMQPLFISTICSSPFSMRSLSTPTSPNSFSITAMRWPWSSLRMRLSSVVFPLPRKPVRMVTGTMFCSCMRAPSEGRDSTPSKNQGQTTFSPGGAALTGKRG